MLVWYFLRQNKRVVDCTLGRYLWTIADAARNFNSGRIFLQITVWWESWAPLPDAVQFIKSEGHKR